ncbi:MAG: hypothetical protein ACLS6O_09590 [Bifidobacterium sp.]
MAALPKLTPWCIRHVCARGIGELRAALESAGLGLQDARFARHGEHAPDVDAPLIMVSCSGGRDSMALAAVAAKACASLGLRCGAIIIDHQLQQALPVLRGQPPIVALRWVLTQFAFVRLTYPTPVASVRQRRVSTLSCDCRRMLRRFGRASGSYEKRQAETVIIGLLRSAGLDAVCGMNGSFIRAGCVFYAHGRCDPRRNRHLRGSAACLVGRSHKWAGCGRFGWK